MATGYRVIVTLNSIGYVFEVVTAGTTGESTPFTEAPSYAGQTYSDNTAAWKYVQNPGSLVPTTRTVNRDIIDDADAITLELASDQNDAIQWIATGEDLVIGTSTGEWILGGDVTATQAVARLMTRYGSSRLQATRIGSAIVFLQGTRLRAYAVGDRGYQSPNLCLLNDDILQEGVVGYDFSQTPYPTIHAYLDDGSIAHLLYDQNAGVIAWYRTTFDDGDAVSVAVLPASGGGDDEIYIAVERMDNDSDTKMTFIEKAFGVFSGYHLDAATVVEDAGASVTATQLYDRTVTVWPLDGSVAAEDVLAVGSSITIPVAMRGKDLIVGLDYEAVYTSSRIITQAQAGPQVFDPKRIAAIWLRVWSTYKLWVTGASSGFAASDETVVLETTPFTGDAVARPIADWTSDRTYSIVARGPYPATVLGAVLEAEV